MLGQCKFTLQPTLGVSNLQGLKVQSPKSLAKKLPIICYENFINYFFYCRNEFLKNKIFIWDLSAKLESTYYSTSNHP